MKEQQKETSAKMVTLNKFAPKDSQTKTDGMYDPAFEHDNCGIGSVVNIKGIKTHETVENALKIVENLKHRAGKDAEGKTGDGVGILLQISHKFFTKAVKPLGIELGGERDYGIGMFFFPQDELKRNQAKKMFEVIVRNGIFRMERSTDRSDKAWTESNRLYALHYAGVCKASEECGKGTSVRPQAVCGKTCV